MKKRAIVTGANRGIGLALVNELQQAGYEVIAMCRKSSDALHALPVKVVENVDVTDIKALEMAKEAIGKTPIDLFVHNAGIAIAGAFDTFTKENFLKQMEVNCFAPLETTRVFKSLLKSGSKVIFVSSFSGSISESKSTRHYGYKASKAALNMVGKTLSNDFAEEGILFGMVDPGLVDTDMTSWIESDEKITPEASAKNLVDLFDIFTEAMSGSFWRANGKEIAW